MSGGKDPSARLLFWLIVFCVLFVVMLLLFADKGSA